MLTFNISEAERNQALNFNFEDGASTGDARTSQRKPLSLRESACPVDDMEHEDTPSPFQADITVIQNHLSQSNQGLP
ncbi:hypothetical protein SARC_08113 [Sphaeroforma arctica JP610]|uniref:Uncharacterized protein n=1 Tax=Sphaeroforma arctica JP610 TaxID=667725 RepID=A0A0L0FRP1_9EUKA|nr:hypothetical protein SARC_08113 [Sphaeroforma arctica JP610]KNC79492.1 hypothetical protein SARC_08113 [Sphaeroforma arctica JP610]|eukprot:XP_014153394.1 hypothetical protein SARC_08113 [Sphaeroforma arctica JP610]